MHAKRMEKWVHDHEFHASSGRAELNTRRVVWLTVIMMVGEIAAGVAFGSMALLADGWHMGTHAAALGITLFAYSYARKHAGNAEFSFGTGKVSVIGGYTSAIILGVVALLMVAESVERLISPQMIRFDQAIGVAVLGLIVNIVSAVMLGGHHHDHHDHHGHGHAHHHDHNLRAAYLHVLADALTSVLAIVALLLGKSLGWVWLDPAMGIVGAVIIIKWAVGLGKETAAILLDRMTEQQTGEKIVGAVEAHNGDKVADLHVWRINSTQLSAIVSVVTHQPKCPDHYKALIQREVGVSHLTVEVQHCRDT
ncbi:CDF family Co(II)/Ni(II) efflux transporter DmeF [Kordiimonas sp.]|uniref:CDF family Co(II)/Ni(II) efflux transporter DmeF n=1 Tax=Kordiimonas sp. TaxID=1970157 RepID=UPI003A90D113